MNLAERLKWLRKKHGLASKKVAAAAMGIKYGTYQRYEYGATPSRKKFEEIATHYKCSLSWLMTGEGDPYPGVQPAGPGNYGQEKPPPESLYIKEGQTAWSADGDAQKIKIDEAMGKAYEILHSGTPYAVALYLNIQQFSGALDAIKEIKTCRDSIAVLQDQVAALRREMESLTARPASTDQPAEPLEKAAM